MEKNLLLFFTLGLLFCSAHCNRDQENGYCSKDGCPDELEEAGDRSAQSWNLFSAIRDTLTSVKDTIKYNVYKAYNKTVEFAGNIYGVVEEFSERVRTVFKEEFTSFLEILWESAVGTNPENGRMESCMNLEFQHR